MSLCTHSWLFHFKGSWTTMVFTAHTDLLSSYFVFCLMKTRFLAITTDIRRKIFWTLLNASFQLRSSVWTMLPDYRKWRKLILLFLNYKCYLRINPAAYSLTTWSVASTHSRILKKTLTVKDHNAWKVAHNFKILKSNDLSYESAAVACRLLNQCKTIVCDQS